MRKKHPEHVNLERWLVSYADFITLLFAFFVVMYALSMSNKAKVIAAAAESIRQAFGASAGPVGIVGLGGSGGGSTANPFDSTESPGGRTLNLPAGKTHTAADPDPELQDVRELLEESISLELGVTDLSDQLTMLFDSRGLVVRVAAKDIFAHGDTDVRQDMRPIIDRIGRVLSKTGRMIRVEGHTDPSEANTEAYPSDWELSAARAAWVVKYWIQRFEMDPRRIAASGHSHHRPLSDGKTEWDRAKNRRVEIIILNNQLEG